MNDSIRVTYLDHSGFVIETVLHTLVFDYYRDPAQALQLHPGKTLYVFASHAHGDHFNPAIAKWQEQASAYILCNDIRAAGGLPSVAPGKVHYLAPYEAMQLADIHIAAYGSTDEGGSFLVEVDGWRIFHAGDLNWWHWKGDTPENIAQAKTDFFRELGRLSGQQLDVAFFPVDSRLEEYRDLGIRELVKTVAVNHLITMHDCGQPWTAPADFTGYQKSLWVPAKPGEGLQLER